MIFDVIMPKIGLTMEEGRIVEWMKSEGSQIAKGEVLVVIEAEKTSYEVESLYAGILHILGEAEKIYPCDAVIAQIAESAEEYSSIQKGVLAPPPEPAETMERIEAPSREKASIAQQGRQAKEGMKDRKISPAALRLAEQKKIDIEKVQGTGIGGIVTREDVLREMRKQEEMAGQRAQARREPMSRLRKTIASRMTSSWQNTPHVLQMLESDASRLLDLRKHLKEIGEKKFNFGVSVSHLLVKLTAAVLEKHPIINARLDLEKNEIVYNDQVNVGVAMATPEGLMVPVIKEANRKSIFEIARTYYDLAEKSSKGNLSVDDLSGGTFTISSLHEQGIENGLAIINPPQSGILFFGTHKKKPVVIDDQIVIRPLMWVSFTYDHRIMDGVTAANFTAAVRKLIENPEQMVWE
jgi:pyruvate dehydrogenase E2 component (dihydrolipoamide acetyltransferase)